MAKRRRPFSEYQFLPRGTRYHPFSAPFQFRTACPSPAGSARTGGLRTLPRTQTALLLLLLLLASETLLVSGLKWTRSAEGAGTGGGGSGGSEARAVGGDVGGGAGGAGAGRRGRKGRGEERREDDVAGPVQEASLMMSLKGFNGEGGGADGATLGWSRDSSRDREYCQLETYHASCPPDSHVLMIDSAHYGRMRLGRCVRQDYGSLGCQADVLPQLDRLCSGRRSCSFQVAGELNGLQPCPPDLTAYLEANYSCIPVLSGVGQRCTARHPVTLTSPHGYIVSTVTVETGRGGPDCPWRIHVLPGQRVNLTLVNFARVGLIKEAFPWVVVPPGTGSGVGAGGGTGVVAVRPKVCYQLATLRERQYTRTLTECEGSARVSHAHLSNTNILDIDVTVAKILNVHFLLHYEAVGCSNPSLPVSMSLRRHGDLAFIRCNNTSDLEPWKLRCVGTEWVGYVGNCTGLENGGIQSAAGRDVTWVEEAEPNPHHIDTFPYHILLVVSVGVAMGVFIGGVLLVCAARQFHRLYGRDMTTSSHPAYVDDDYYCQHGIPPPQDPGPGVPSPRTILVSCGSATGASSTLDPSSGPDDHDDVTTTTSTSRDGTLIHLFSGRSSSHPCDCGGGGGSGVYAAYNTFPSLRQTVPTRRTSGGGTERGSGPPSLAVTGYLTRCEQLEKTWAARSHVYNSPEFFDSS